MAFEYGPPKLQKYSSAASKFINTFLVMTQLGFCCVYFLFVATNLQEVNNWKKKTNFRTD